MTDVPPKRGILDPAFIVFGIAYLLINIPSGMIGSLKSKVAASLEVPLDTVTEVIAISDYIFALALIPASLLITRFSPGALAWIAILLCSLGIGTRWLAQDVLMFLGGASLSALGWALTIPLVGQIARNRLTTGTFVIATTILFVLAQGLQSISLMLADFLDGIVEWRTLYLISFLMLLPPSLLVWIFVKPSRDFESGSVRATLGIAWRLLRNPVLWLAGLASALFLATLSDFGYIWNLNFQMALGWDPEDSVILSFIFLIGMIAGGTSATIVARWIGGYATMLLGMSYGCVTFGIALVFTPDRHQLLFVVPLLFTMGLGFGSCSMILPYFARFFEKQSSGMFFAVAETINAFLIGLLISVPLWVEETRNPWTEVIGIDAMFPYLYTFLTGLAFYVVLGLLQRLTGKKPIPTT